MLPKSTLVTTSFGDSILFSITTPYVFRFLLASWRTNTSIPFCKPLAVVGVLMSPGHAVLVVLLCLVVFGLLTCLGTPIAALYHLSDFRYHMSW